MAIPSASATSSSEAPCSSAALAWKPMQSSHRIPTAMPSAISSLVLPSSALGADAARAMAANAFITSGASPRKFLSCAVRSFVLCGQLVIVPSPPSLAHRWAATMNQRDAAVRLESPEPDNSPIPGERADVCRNVVCLRPPQAEVHFFVRPDQGKYESIRVEP